MKTRWAQYWFTRVRAFMNMTHPSTAGPTLTVQAPKESYFVTQFGPLTKSLYPFKPPN